MVTIISAIYKSERYLAGYLKHAKEFARYLQEKKFPFEIAIIPTLPSEREKELLDTVRGERWCKVYEFDQPGLYRAWNFGVSKAQGEVMGPWNADDIRFPEAVVEAQRLANSGVDVSYYPFYLKRYISFGPFSMPVITRTVEGDVLTFEKRKFQTTMTAGPHFMFTKKAFERVGPFDEQFKIAGDFDWIARAASSDLEFRPGTEYSGIFRVDGHGLSAGANKKLQAENNIVYKRHGAVEKVTPGLEEQEQQYRQDEAFYEGKWHPFRT